MCELLAGVTLCTTDLYTHQHAASVNTAPVKNLETLQFVNAFNEVSAAHQGCIFLIKYTVKTIIIGSYYYQG